MGKGKIKITYAGGAGDYISFNLTYRNGSGNTEYKGQSPHFISDFIRRHKGCKLDCNGINDTWSSRFAAAGR